MSMSVGTCSIAVSLGADVNLMVAPTPGSTAISFSSPVTFAAGIPVVFATEPGTIYHLASAVTASTAGELDAPYSGPAGSTTIVAPQLQATIAGDADSLALFYAQRRAARLLATLNETLEASLLSSTNPTAQANIVNGILAAAQSHAQDLANQCEDDAALVAYLQQNAQVTISTSTGNLQTSTSQGKATAPPATPQTLPIT